MMPAQPKAKIMAEIRVEDKKQRSGGSPWGWIIGLIVVGLAVWFVVEAFDNDVETEELTEVDDTEMIEQEEGYAETNAMDNDANALYMDVEEYGTFVSDEAYMENNAEQYVHDGLTRLVRAISAIHTAGEFQAANFDNDKQTILNTANSITTADLGNESAQVRDAFMKSAEMLQTLQQSDDQFIDFDNEIDGVMSAAQSITPDVPLNEQMESISEFFESSQEVIEDLADEMEVWDDMASVDY